MVNNRAYYFSSLGYTEKNQDVIKVLIDEINQVDVWGAANKDALAAELSQLWGLPRSVGEATVGRTVFGVGPITKGILAEQQAIADTFFSLKLIPKKINVLDAAAAGLA